MVKFFRLARLLLLIVVLAVSLFALGGCDGRHHNVYGNYEVSEGRDFRPEPPPPAPVAPPVVVEPARRDPTSPIINNVNVNVNVNVVGEGRRGECRQLESRPVYHPVEVRPEPVEYRPEPVMYRQEPRYEERPPQQVVYVRPQVVEEPRVAYQPQQVYVQPRPMIEVVRPVCVQPPVVYQQPWVYCPPQGQRGYVTPQPRNYQPQRCR